MANGGYEKRLGARVLALKRDGSDVSPDLAASARRAVQGTATDADIAALQRKLGEGRSGATFLRNVVKQYNAVSTPLANISREIDILTTTQAGGRSSAAAQARLVQTLTKETEKIIKSPGLRKTFEGVFKRMGEDPAGATVIVNALRRGLRLGGMVGTFLAGGVALAEDIVTRSGQFHQTVGAIKDINRAIGGDPRAAARTEAWIRRNVESQTLFKPSKNSGDFMDAVKDAVRQGMEEEVKKEVELEASSRTKGRKLLGAMGIDANAVLVERARQLGRSVVDLTPRQRQEAIDDATDNYNRRTGLDIYSDYVNSEWAKLGSAERTKLEKMGPDAVRAKREQLARQERRRMIDTLEAKKQERLESASLARERMTPEELFEERVMLEERQATWMAYRSRRVAWSNDFY